MLRFLIRKYSKSITAILETYDKYFDDEEKQDFWSFFNEQLDLPEDWYRLANLEIITEGNEILKLIKKYDEDGYWHLINGDAVVVEDHLDYLAETYTIDEIESMMKAGDSDFITLDI